MNEILSTLTSVVSVINSLSALVGKLPPTLFPSNKKKLEAVQSEIEIIKNEILTVRSSLDQSKNLIIAYSDALIEVSIAYSLANKLSELFTHVPILSEISLFFVNQTKQNLNDVEYKLRNLPKIDSTEFGRLQAGVEQLKRTMQEINRCNSTDSEILKQRFSQLSDEYNALKLELRSYLDRLMGRS